MRHLLVRRFLVIGLGCGVLAVPSPALASEPVHARLVYNTDDPAGACASEAEFRGKVAARLGYDPFQADAAWLFRVRVDARRKPAHAEILTEQDGKSTGRRALDETRCDALLETVASTVAIAIDPVAATPGPAPLPPPPAGTAAAARSGNVSAARDTTVASPVPKASPSAPVVPYLYLDGTGAFGRTAGTALGGRAGFGLRYRGVSVAGEARGEATPDAVRLTALDSAYWSVFSGGIVGCGDKSIFELCAVFAMGSLQAKARNVDRPSLKGTLFASVGARLGIEVPIAGEIALRANAELGIPLVRTTFIVAGEPVWTAPAGQGTFALGAEARFR